MAIHNASFPWSNRTKALSRLQKYEKHTLRESKTHQCTPKHIKMTGVRSNRSQEKPHRAGTLGSLTLSVSKKLSTPSRASLISWCLRRQCWLAERKAKDAQSLFFATKPMKDVSKAAKMVQKLSLGSRSDIASLKEIRNTVVNHRRKIFKVEDLPKSVVPTETFPSPSKLIQNRAFGKPSLSCLYSIETSLRHCCVILWKEYLDQKSSDNLASAIGNDGIAMLKKVRRHQRTNFSALQLLPYDWDVEDEDPAMEKRIMRWKQELNDACFIHYNMDTEAFQRFCGGRRTNDHQRNLQMLKVMSHIIPTDRFLALGAGVVDGVPTFSTEMYRSWNYIRIYLPSK